MPELPLRPVQWVTHHPWLWGVYLGIVVAATVVLLSAITRGFRPGLLLLGVVLLIAFGGLGAIGALLRRYNPGGPV